MNRFFLLLSLGLSFWQCAQKAAPSMAGFRANPLPDSVQIYTLQPDEELPGQSEFVRDIQVGTSFFASNCGYKNLMTYTRFQAKQSGANVIYFTEIRRPAIGNGCYHFSAKLYKNGDKAQMEKLASARNTANQSRLPKDADYAIVHFYRPRDYEGAAISYNIRMDDQGTIGKASNGNHFDYKITQFGKHRFTGKTKKQDSVTIDIEKGKEYFVRCGVTKGSGISIPDMYVIENYVGIRQLSEMQ